MTGKPERTVLNDRYEIQQRIGRGGMADVFLARDLLLDRPVAIKVLFPEFAIDPNFVERFRREAQSAANLNHPNIVGVYDWGQYANTYFMAMEYVQGRTLADILRANGHVNSHQAAEIASEVAAALGFAHRNGVVHRDIKPANILIGTGGQVKVADFGIARAMNAPTESNLTQAGSVMGTATYFSPEQAQGAQPDPRSDLYSLGIVLYEMIAGRPPFSGENPVSIAYKQVHELPQPLNQLVADVPKSFEAIVAKLLSKRPEVRYPTAEAVRDDLRRFRSGEPVMALAAVMGAAAAAGNGNGNGATVGPNTGSTTAVPRTTANPQTAPQPRAAQAIGTVAMPRTDGVPQQGGRGGQYPDQRPRGAMGGGLYAVIGFFALVALVVGGIVLFNVLSKDSQPSSFGMPDVVNQQLDVGTQALTDKGLKVTSVKEVNAKFSKGAIVRTDPLSGVVVQRGQTVTVYFNPADTPFKLPDLGHIKQQDAIDTLTGLGLTVDPTIITETTPGYDPGTVVRTDPAAGTQVSQGDTVKIVISAAPGDAVVPSTAAMTQASAKTLLEGTDYGFVVTVTPEASGTVPAGTVTRTDPPATTLAKKGDPITLYVSSGPAPVTVPPVAGLTEAAARGQLLSVGLQAQVVYQDVPAGNASDGHVISQTPSSPTPVPLGSTVKLIVGRAVAATTTTASPTTTVAPATTTTQPTTP
ncbi:MAG: Stk1 family PASTA domain-containing Ser/Thr kinase [Actinobacteria bacterium]|uniref:Unannotated protein n=1 Tax=freshwater metagenome TaxID=449393 RepID=A0A6J7BRE5_9ZZZZ|nr:Stk1 family PASTA domain-containing Ser/Thr kinase [Actinomycetota bacterium]MSW76742.1 Stk1 family PASTA domain-containing Ser/Thr kinase [Actinomycetota bacterium]MSX54552.1 Stk1 family PASTA domain-containing Ser/Thr kinase [Actinomycetota bacterium]MSX91969.1 Stk1 family PASTA domain-containing Ser/Thr kinase [Actinomycetota bacterium]MSZ82189.1 Stk1 family PASTA domain-containing Ser/Thr kinase [Actinomycetota bacterium]